MSKEVAVYGGEGALSITELKGQVNLIQHVMKEVMKDKEHYGLIPGCGDKKSLFKSGAEKLIMTFRLVPEIDVEVVELEGDHREYRTKVTMFSANGLKLGQGVGSCSTKEGKYRFRNADQKCPACDKETIIKGKQQYGGGWLCYKKKGGCGEKFKDGDPTIENQEMGRIEHDNPADYYNTCLKMSKKRGVVDAVLTVTAASDIFTQDIEDMPEVIPGAAKTAPPAESKPNLEESVVEIKPESEVIPEAETSDVPVASDLIDPPDEKGDIKIADVKRIFAKLNDLGIKDDMAQRKKVSDILCFNATLPSMNYLNETQGGFVIDKLIELEKAAK